MKSIKSIRNIIISSFLALFMLPGTVCAEAFSYDLLQKGKSDLPLEILFSSPQYSQIAQFGQERKDDLNKLLKHFSFSVVSDGNEYENTIQINGENVISQIENLEGYHLRIYEQDSVYTSEKIPIEATKSVFEAFLDEQYFPINQMLDDLYVVFEKSADTFQEYARSATVALNFQGYGKGVKRLTIPIPDQVVKEHFPETLAALAETEESRQFLNRLVFSGPQKIVLLFDNDNHLLRINYDGIAGTSADSLRKVSVVWRALRSETITRDNLSLKTPAQKGNDKYNIIYEREINQTDPSNHVVSCSMQIDLKADQVKKKIEFTSALSSDSQAFGGDIVYSEKQDKEEQKIIVKPSLIKENENEYSGTIEIDNYSGKIITNIIISDINIITGEKARITKTEDEAKTHRSLTATPVESLNQIQAITNTVLIRKMLSSIPEEDMSFFRMDIPDDIWNTIMQTLQ